MKKMLKFIFPIWIAMVVNSLLIITDFFFLGKISSSYLTVVGIAYVPFSLMSSIIVGLGIEANRATAKKTPVNFIQVIIFTIILSILIIITAIFFSDYILFFVKDNILYNEIKSFFIILSFLIIPTSIFYLCTGILRGNGVPGKSIYFNISAVVLNFIFDYLFIKVNVFGNPLKGCAFATVLSDSIVVIIYVFYLFKSKYARICEMKLFNFIKNSMTYSTEKIFSASTIQIITSIYIAKLDLISSSSYFAIEKFFLPVILLSYCHFEWILFSKSKDLEYNSKKTYGYYFLLVFLYDLFIIAYLNFNSNGKLYSYIYILYCMFFFIERSLVAIFFSKEKGKYVNLIILIKNIFLICILHISLIFNKLNLISFGFINCILVFIECLVLSVLIRKVCLYNNIEPNLVKHGKYKINP